MTNTIPTNSSQTQSLKPGDQMHFHNRQSAPVRIRVTTQCGTETEAELHPGAIFRLKVGNSSANVDILPPADE